MKIVRMNTSSFWKGEAGVKGLVEDQGKTYNVTLYLGCKGLLLFLQRGQFL